jgi:hypothetical protein
VDLTSARRVFLLGLVGSMCATAALAVAILLFSQFDETAGRVLGSTAALSFFSLLALPAGVLLDRGHAVALAWASLALSAVGLVLVLVVLWVDWDDDIPAALGKGAITATVFAIAGAQAAATTSRRREGDSTAVRALHAVGVALALVVATMAAGAAWAEIEAVGYYRALAALAVLAVLATLLQPVLRRMAGPAPEPAGEAAHRIRITLANGRSLDREVRGRDFAEAVARAVRAAERDGSVVTRIERLEADPGPS